MDIIVSTTVFDFDTSSGSLVALCEYKPERDFTLDSLTFVAKDGKPIVEQVKDHVISECNVEVCDVEVFATDIDNPGTLFVHTLAFVGKYLDSFIPLESPQFFLVWDCGFAEDSIVMRATRALAERMNCSLSAAIKLLGDDTFTLGDMREVYSAVFGGGIDRSNFRRKLLATNLLEQVDDSVPAVVSNRASATYRLANPDNSRIVPCFMF